MYMVVGLGRVFMNILARAGRVFFEYVGGVGRVFLNMLSGGVGRVFYEYVGGVGRVFSPKIPAVNNGEAPLGRLRKNKERAPGEGEGG